MDITLSGEKVAANALTNVSGMLLKAVLINGARQLEGFDSLDNTPLESAPSMKSGFGRVDLANSLKLKKSTQTYNHRQICTS